MQYREVGAPSYTNHDHEGTDLTTTLTGLTPGTSYQVQVRATNAEGTGDWSPSGTGTTGANAAPVFAFPSGETSYGFTLAENEDGSSTAIAIGTVSATDADPGHTVTYAIAAGDDDGVFASGSTSGVITYTGSGENFEGFSDPSNAFALTVRASDGAGGSADATVTLAVTGVAGEAPGTTAATGVTAIVDSLTSIDVSWTAPANPGSAITDYDVQLPRVGGDRLDRPRGPHRHGH